MWPALEPLEQIQDLVESGGYVLWGIFLVSLLLWSLIIERYLYLRLVHPRYLDRMRGAWGALGERTSWQAGKIRQAMLSQVAQRLSRSLGLIRSLIAICPLLGLLGTVVGMVHVFDAMAVVGSANARAMAAGVSMATIPTMAGMVVALSGLYFSTHLQRRAVLENERAAESLRRHPD